MNIPHKHAALIKAWADGATIEVNDGLAGSVWVSCWPPSPAWIPDYFYRIKPEPKPDVTIYGCIHASYEGPTHKLAAACRVRNISDNIMLIFDGETGKLKSAEVL